MIDQIKVHLDRVILFIPKKKSLSEDAYARYKASSIGCLFRDNPRLKGHELSYQAKELASYGNHYVFNIPYTNTTVFVGTTPLFTNEDNVEKLANGQPAARICFNIKNKEDLCIIESLFPDAMISSLEYSIDLYGPDTAEIKKFFKHHLIAGWKRQQNDYEHCSFIGTKNSQNSLKYYIKTDDNKPLFDIKTMKKTKEHGDFVRLEYRATCNKLNKVFGNKDKSIQHLIRDAHFEEIMENVFQLRTLKNVNIRNKSLQYIYDNIKRKNKSILKKHREDLDNLEARILKTIILFDQKWKADDGIWDLTSLEAEPLTSLEAEPLTSLGTELVITRVPFLDNLLESTISSTIHRYSVGELPIMPFRQFWSSRLLDSSFYLLKLNPLSSLRLLDRKNLSTNISVLPYQT